jgi:hypothetical protein
MAKHIYKIQNTKTLLFWSGVCSSFNSQGKKFNSVHSAAYSININQYLDPAIILDCQVVKFQVELTVQEKTSLQYAVQRVSFYQRLTQSYGRDFSRSLCNLEKSGTVEFKYAVSIPPQKISLFQKQMKDLGFSSRCYRKVDNWLWISGNDVLLSIKMLDHHTNIVYLKDEEVEFNKSMAAV